MMIKRQWYFPVSYFFIVREPGEQYAEMPAEEYADGPKVSTVESVGKCVPYDDEATCHTNPSRQQSE